MVVFLWVLREWRSKLQGRHGFCGYPRAERARAPCIFPLMKTSSRISNVISVHVDKTLHRVNRQLGEQVELRHVGVAPKLKLHLEDESEMITNCFLFYSAPIIFYFFQ